MTARAAPTSSAEPVNKAKIECGFPIGRHLLGWGMTWKLQEDQMQMIDRKQRHASSLGAVEPAEMLAPEWTPPLPPGGFAAEDTPALPQAAKASPGAANASAARKAAPANDAPSEDACLCLRSIICI
jgi:hypothetical protein